jgi:ABC-type branched-subunit amino acid transport system substrate-binding protein
MSSLQKKSKRQLDRRQIMLGGGAVLAAMPMVSIDRVKAAGKVVKIGGWGPQTGPNSSSFPIAAGTDAFFKSLNEAGGINGYTFEFLLADDQYNPALTVSVVRKLVEQDDVFAIVGGVGTGPALAVNGYLEQKAMPNIMPHTSNTKVATPHTFMLFPSAVNEGAFLARHAIRSYVKSKKLGFVYQNDDLGKPQVEGAKFIADKEGVELVTVPFQLNTIDFVPAVGQLNQAGVQAVLLSGATKVYAPIIKAAESISFRPKWLAASYHANPDILKTLPEQQQSNLFYSTFMPMPGSASVKMMEEAVKKHYSNIAPSTLTIQGWIPGTVFAEAFRRVTNGGKEPTREALVAALNDFKGYSNDYIKNISYAAGPGIESPHVPRPYEAIMTWEGSKMALATDFEEIPKVPGQPGQ